MKCPGNVPACTGYRDNGTCPGNVPHMYRDNGTHTLRVCPVVPSAPATRVLPEE